MECEILDDNVATTVADEVASVGAVLEKSGLEVVCIRAEALKENPYNVEIVGDVSELALSIEQNGFTDPITVTDFGMDDSFYMIVSGHRRFKAGKECGMDEIPCIVKHFKEKAEMLNQMLLSQSSKDTTKDPLLIQRRCKANYEYLELIGYKGSIREEIARRLGLSTREVDRHLHLDRLINPIVEMVENGTAGLAVSSVDPVSSLLPEGQEAILEQMRDAADRGERLTRDRVADMVRRYKRGDDEESGKDIRGEGNAEEAIHESDPAGMDIEVSEDADLKDVNQEDDEDDERRRFSRDMAVQAEAIQEAATQEADVHEAEAQEAEAYDWWEEPFDDDDTKKDADETSNNAEDDRFGRLYGCLVEVKELLGDGRYVPENPEDGDRLLEILREVSGKVMININCLHKFRTSGDDES